MAKYNNQILTDLFCLNCGNKGIPIYRKRNGIREAGHRKALYCIHCRETVNHYECRNSSEIYDFKQRFAAGEFAEEAKNSIAYIKAEKGSMIL